jgi:hypothetical protein
MKKVTLYILGSYDKRSVEVADELTIGRTDASIWSLMTVAFHAEHNHFQMVKFF